LTRLVLATTNSHKVEEIQAAIAASTDWSVEPQPDFVPEIEETATTFIENAILKAVHVSKLVDGLVLGDDSGLCIDALDGRPGVFSARYASNAAERILRVLTEMASVNDERRGAVFVCALALARGGEVMWTTEGRVEGRITHKPMGTHGFGYDPIFWIPELGKTMAELTQESKNLTSHRGRALRQLALFLKSQ